MGKIQDEQHTRLLLSILETLSGASIGIEKEDTDCGIISIPEFKYMPTIEFTEGEIELIKALGDEFGFDFSTLTEETD